MAVETDARSLTRHRLVEQVYGAIFSEITEGRLAPNTRLIQDELAEAYGVSRQPVQQALLLLRNHGIVRDAPRRGLVVAPLEASFVQNLYEVRGVLEGLTARLAAERNPARA
ncbi:GntR family transcriptional regulator, partial [Methylobacterium ajmalii]